MNVNVFWIHEYCYCGELNFHLILRRKKINIWKLNIKQILIVHIKINILFFYFNNTTKETFLKNSNIAIFRNMSNITDELIFTSRQTMQIGFATYLDISHHCIDSSCAEFSFVFFFQCLQMPLQMRYVTQITEIFGFCIIQYYFERDLISRICLIYC